MYNSSNRGFTLIELLVVIAIIGILSSVVLSSLGVARNKAFDSQRVSNLRAIQTSLALFYNDHNAYPTTNLQWFGWSASASSFIPGLIPTYLPSMPVDPQVNKNANKTGMPECEYLYNSNGVDYKLLFHNCPTSNVCYGSGEKNGGFYDPIRPTWACQISTPGAKSW